MNIKKYPCFGEVYAKKFLIKINTHNNLNAFQIFIAIQNRILHVPCTAKWSVRMCVGSSEISEMAMPFN